MANDLKSDFNLVLELCSAIFKKVIFVPYLTPLTGQYEKQSFYLFHVKCIDLFMINKHLINFIYLINLSLPSTIFFTPKPDEKCSCP